MNEIVQAIESVLGMAIEQLLMPLMGGLVLLAGTKLGIDKKYLQKKVDGILKNQEEETKKHQEKVEEHKCKVEELCTKLTQQEEKIAQLETKVVDQEKQFTDYKDSQNLAFSKLEQEIHKMNENIAKIANNIVTKDDLKTILVQGKKAVDNLE